MIAYKEEKEGTLTGNGGRLAARPKEVSFCGTA